MPTKYLGTLLSTSGFIATANFLDIYYCGIMHAPQYSSFGRAEHATAQLVPRQSEICKAAVLLPMSPERPL